MIINKLFLNAGAMKAGTTWLYSILQKHPDLYFTYEKEIHFWSDYTLGTHALDIEKRSEKAQNAFSNLHRDIGVNALRKRLQWYASYLNPTLSLKWYVDLFRHNRGDRYNCDFSNLTCHMNEKGWDLVRHVAKEVKVIYIVRDPLKRLWSHVKFHHEFVGKEIDFRSWSEDQFSDFIDKRFIWENCEYADKIKVMKQNLAEDEFRVLYFEDMVGDPINSLKDLERFLGVQHLDYSHLDLDKPVNQSKKIDMPDNFHSVAFPKLEKELEKLVDLSIRIHDQWTTK